jgi:hypothetical protein
MNISKVLAAFVPMAAIIAAGFIGDRAAAAADQLFFGAKLAAPRLALPPPTGPGRPYRDTRMARCDNVAPFENLCEYRFRVVGVNRLLRVDNVSCGFLTASGSTNLYLVFSSNDDAANLQVVAMLPGQQVVDLGESAIVNFNHAGPYYFTTGDRPTLFGPGDENSGCMIHGELSPTG